MELQADSTERSLCESKPTTHTGLLQIKSEPGLACQRSLDVIQKIQGPQAEKVLVSPTA